MTYICNFATFQVWTKAVKRRLDEVTNQQKLDVHHEVLKETQDEVEDIAHAQCRRDVRAASSVEHSDQLPSCTNQPSARETSPSGEVK